MPLTRAFKSGNSQAVRIPAELAYEDTNVDLTITRLGDIIVIAPARATMKEMIAKLRAIPQPDEHRNARPTRGARSRVGLTFGLPHRHEYRDPRLQRLRARAR